MTNGGGKTEEERCLQLSKQLEMEVSPGQFICGHTPMREMAEKYNSVLVVGGEGEKCRQVAEGYGFKDVITPGDIIKVSCLLCCDDARHSLIACVSFRIIQTPLHFVSSLTRNTPTQGCATSAKSRLKRSLCSQTVEIGLAISKSFWTYSRANMDIWVLDLRPSTKVHQCSSPTTT